jgi:hypothetical protein
VSLSRSETLVAVFCVVYRLNTEIWLRSISGFRWLSKFSFWFVGTTDHYSFRNTARWFRQYHISWVSSSMQARKRICSPWTLHPKSSPACWFHMIILPVKYLYRKIYIYICFLVSQRFLATGLEVLGSFPCATAFSEWHWVWNGVRSALWW